MRLVFLCPIHRDWIYFHPEEALNYLENVHNKGHILLVGHCWREAIPYLGSAFETAEILLQLHGSEEPSLADKLSNLAIALAKSYQAVDEVHNGLLILEQSLSQLHSVTARETLRAFQANYPRNASNPVQPISDGHNWELNYNRAHLALHPR